MILKSDARYLFGSYSKYYLFIHTNISFYMLYLMKIRYDQSSINSLNIIIGLIRQSFTSNKIWRIRG